MFVQVLNPLGNPGLTVLIALIPVITLLVMLAVFRITAWLATLICSIPTLILAIVVWGTPISNGIQAYFIGAATGAWVHRPKELFGLGYSSPIPAPASEVCCGRRTVRP